MGQRWSVRWQERHIGYILHHLLRGDDEQTIRAKLSRSREYPDLTDDEWAACYARALRDARASVYARAHCDTCTVADCYRDR